MSKALTLVATATFRRADEILADVFDYEDGSLERKRMAIAANLMSMARGEDDGIGLKHIWTSGMMNDSGKANIINGLKEMPTADADDAVKDVWDHMGDEHKQMHLNNHPESRYKVQEDHNQQAEEDHARAEVEEQNQHQENHDELRERNRRRNRRRKKADDAAGTEQEGDDDWWNKMSLKEQRAYLKQHPRSRKARRWRVGIRNTAMKATRHIQHEVRKMGHDYKNGMEGLRQLRKGKKMTDEQKEGLKKTAKRVGVLLIAALGTAAMFTPLQGVAMHLGDKYLEYLNNHRDTLEKEHEVQAEKEETTVGEADPNNEAGGETTVGQTDPAPEPSASESGVNLHGTLKKSTREGNKADEMELAWMQHHMTDWLCAQDTEKLAEELKDAK